MTWESTTEAVVQFMTPTGALKVRPAPITEVAGQFPDPSGRTIYIITAENPNARNQSDAERVQSHRRLLARLIERGLEYWNVVIGDATWTNVDQGVAVAGFSETEALALGRDFHQEAVFAWTPQTWCVISCDGNRRSTTGWTSRRDQASRDLQAGIDLLGLQGPTYTVTGTSEAFRLALSRTDPKRQDELRAALALVKEHIASQDKFARAGAQA